MAKRVKYLARGVFFLILIIFTVVIFRNLRASNMVDIKVDIGGNIVETAKSSGVTRFSTRNIAGLISYSVDSLPDNIPITYTRHGYEGSFGPLFALTMYADHEHNNNLAVTDLVLQYSTDLIKEHKSGQALIESINTKFRGKKWVRHIPDYCPRVTGRSNFIAIDGQITIFEACPLDPEYHLSAEEWRALVVDGLSYEWVGGGVIATLLVRAPEDSRGITYDVSLEYADQNIKIKRDAKNQAEKLADGDKQGWNSTAKYKAGMIRVQEKIKVLEANAIKRGDSLVTTKFSLLQ